MCFFRMGRSKSQEMRKIRKDLALSPESIQYLNEYVEQHPELRISGAVDRIIEEHKKLTESALKKQEISTKVLAVKLNEAIWNSRVLVEMMNSLVVSLKLDKDYTTDFFKSNVLIKSEEAVRKALDHDLQTSAYNKRKREN